jgi:hypothetical protein
MFHPPDLLNMYSNSRMSVGQVGQVGTAAGSGSHTDGGSGGSGGGVAPATSGYFIMALKGKARRAMKRVHNPKPLGTGDYENNS